MKTTHAFALFIPLFIHNPIIGHAAPAPDTLVYCSEATPSSLNPVTTIDGASIDLLTQIYEGLTAHDPKTGEAIPRLATKWTAAKDGKSFVFDLRTDVEFHTTANFKPTRKMNADDVVFSLNRLLDPSHPFHKQGKGYPIFLATNAKEILAGVKKLSEHKVEVRLHKPYAPFLEVMAGIQIGGIFSAEYGAQTLAEGRALDLDEKPVGTGPYKFESMKKDQIVRLSVHLAYYRGPAKAAKVVFAITPDASTRVQKLRTGECDVIFQPSPQDVEQLATNPDVKLQQKLGLNFGLLAFNVKKKPFDDARVRLALAHALNRKNYLAAIYDGKAKEIAAPVPFTSWAHAVAAPAPAYDPEKAKALLKEAGLEQGFDTTLWSLPVSRPYIPNGKRLAELMQADLAKVGVRAKIVTFEWGTYLEKASKYEHDILQIGLSVSSPDPDSALHLNLACSSVTHGENPSAWCNPEFDKKLSEARSKLDRKERLKLYGEAFAILAKETPLMPLFTNQLTHVVSKRVASYEPAFNGSVYFYGSQLSK